MAQSSTHPPRRSGRSRRWLQYSLRALLLVTLLAAVLVAWQRERLSRWVESLWHDPRVEPVKDPRDPKQFVSDFVAYVFLGGGKAEDAEQLLSRKAREWNRKYPEALSLHAPIRWRAAFYGANGESCVFLINRCRSSGLPPRSSVKNRLSNRT
jgi:hypothetical protein